MPKVIGFKLPSVHTAHQETWRDMGRGSGAGSQLVCPPPNKTQLVPTPTTAAVPHARAESITNDLQFGCPILI